MSVAPADFWNYGVFQIWENDPLNHHIAEDITGGLWLISLHPGLFNRIHLIACFFLKSAFFLRQIDGIGNEEYFNSLKNKVEERISGIMFKEQKALHKELDGKLKALAIQSKLTETLGDLSEEQDLEEKAKTIKSKLLDLLASKKFSRQKNPS